MNAPSTLTAFSEDLAQLIDRTHPSVAHLDARRRGPASAVIWDKGVLVTTSHVVEREERITITGAGGREVTAELVGRDPSTDLAILKADTGDLPAPTWTDAQGLRPGHLFTAIARPGAGPAALLGQVCAVDDAWRTYSGGRLDRYIETAIEPRPGFGGSLAVDTTGAAIGINTGGLLRNRTLIIPAATLRRVVAAVLNKGAVQRGFLGIGSYPVRLPPALAQETGQESALIIVSVQPDGPAEKAGVLLGDVLIAVDGKPVPDVGSLLALLDEERIGTAAALLVARAGVLRDLSATVGARSWS